MKVKKWKQVKFILGFIWVATLICGSVGGGLYFGGVFSSSDPLMNSTGGSTTSLSEESPNGSSGNNSEVTPEKILKDVSKLSEEPEYLTSYSSMESADGNAYEYSCEFTNVNGQILDAAIDFSRKKTGDIECIYINKNRDINEKLNLFPVITFHGERDVLGKLNQNGFAALSNGETEERKEQKIRANAKRIADKIMNQLSYGSEFSLLDEIFFSAQIDIQEIKSAGLYSRTREMAFGENNGQGNNSRRISIKMEEPTTFAAGGTIDAVGYLDNILYTLAHEYGHHLTLYNDWFAEPNSFLNELKKVFSDNAEDFSDFEKIYKYFNNLNGDWRKNYDQLSSRNSKPIEDRRVITEARDEILRIYRNKYLGNVISLLEEFPEITQGDSNNEADIRWNLETLQSDITTPDINSPIFSELLQLINSALSESGINTTEYNELRQYLTSSPIYVFYHDLDQVFQRANTSFGRRYYFLPASFRQVANSPTFKPNGQNGATVGDIFGNDIDIENTDYPDTPPDYRFLSKVGTKDNACSSLPLTFSSVGHDNYEARYFKAELEDSQYWNKTYSEISEIHDMKIMERLSYYYGNKELLARLYATLTYRYETKVPLTACAFKSGVYYSDTEKETIARFRLDTIGYERQFYLDYSLFKAWGMDILHGENAKTMLKALVQIKNTTGINNSSDFTIIQNERITSGENDDQKKNFFLSFNLVNEKYSKYTSPWSGMYLLGYINRDITKNNIFLEYDYEGHLFYKKALNYNYNNFQYYDPTEPNKLVNWTSNDFTKSKLFPQQDNLMLLVFPLYSLTGTVSPNEPNTVIPNYQDAQTKLGSPKRIFIDTNENAVFDEDDILLAISS